jgi:uncharacterized protein YdcH (DUF465 family)
MIIAIEALIIVILGYICVIQAVSPVTTPLFDEKPYRDSINALKLKNAELDRHIKDLDSINHELDNAKNQIVYETLEKIKVVYTANPDTLQYFILSEIE